MFLQRWRSAVGVSLFVLYAGAVRPDDSVFHTLRVGDRTATHRHPAGQSFRVSVTSASRRPLRAQWVDADGTALSAPWPFKKSADVSSPVRPIGYVGLRMEADGNNAVRPLSREFGFVFEPVSRAPADEAASLIDVPLGGVDPVPTVMDTAVGIQTIFLPGWEMEGCPIPAPDEGGPEPLAYRVAGRGWAFSDDEHVSARALTSLRRSLRACFEAHPRVLHWVLGGAADGVADAPFGWTNLHVKATMARRTADEVNPRIRLICPLTLDRVEAFLSRPVADQFDILGLSMIDGPDFPSPDFVFPDQLARLREVMTERQPEMPLWLIAVGAPRASSPGMETREPEASRSLSRREQADYLVKAAILGWVGGADRVFWHRAADALARSESLDNRFGLYDGRGFPTPAWAAWQTLRRLTAGRRLVRRQSVATASANDLSVYRFLGPDYDVWVVWRARSDERHVLWQDLGVSPDGREILSVTDGVGTGRSVSAAGLDVSDSPLYLRVRRGITPAGT